MKGSEVVPPKFTGSIANDPPNPTATQLYGNDPFPAVTDFKRLRQIGDGRRFGVSVYAKSESL